MAINGKNLKKKLNSQIKKLVSAVLIENLAKGRVGLSFN